MDVTFLNNLKKYSYGSELTYNLTCLHMFAYVNAKFPVGNWGDQLGPYITGILTFFNYFSSRT